MLQHDADRRYGPPTPRTTSSSSALSPRATGAAERWRDAMAPSPLGYRSVLVVQLRRVWGCFCARENARLKLARPPRTRQAHGRRPVV